MSLVQLGAGKECGHFDYYERSPDLIEYGSYLKNTCRPEWGTALARSFHPVGSVAYRAVMLAIPVGFVLAAKKRNAIVLGTLAIPLLFLFMYSFGGAYVNDRYGLPLFPYGVTALVYVSCTLKSRKISFNYKQHGIAQISV